MHCALQLDDIIYILFRHVNKLEPSAKYSVLGDDVGRKTLAALARTCRIFHGPALDVLWGDLYFPHPLVECLPHSGDQWYLDDHTNILNASDWEVLQKYVPRVLSLTISQCHEEVPFYHNVLIALRQQPVTQPPLPNLQRLDCRHLIPEDYPLLDIFFVPSMTDLTIHIYPVDFPNIPLSISPLATLCPRLTSLRLFGYGSHERIKATVSDVIMGLPYLQTLRCDELSQAAITFIAWHPSLTELDLTIPSGHQYDFSQFPHPTLPRIPPFSRIKSFGMNSRHLTDITAFIQTVQPSPSHLRINATKGSSLQGLQEFFSALSNQRRCESMQSLRFQSNKLPPAASIDMDTIKPLLRFSKLRELHLSMVKSFQFSDEEVAVMGSSWPCLEDITLNDGDGPGRVRPSPITLRGLILLVNKCPRLRSAHLAIDARVLEGIEERPASMVGANDLQHLVLAETTVEDPRAFALIVSLAFPKVKEVVIPRYSWWRIPSDEPRWGKVNEYLEVFRLSERNIEKPSFVDT
ncbi:uncharacterized protein EDB91DRAFT_1206239 [Suillus paluster]|uniref:uncharacterized protein n=1 Tax=Suillus paluster TaxID=48578 RepID=UPI001B880E29|nr:uncharacterized protein EDB91DRAFT_1206239 [Suillus paluster]KAG1731988.1 hypothetical protein EDB91DRAFT_1206239 [Suillus paluster]